MSTSPFGTSWSCAMAETANSRSREQAKQDFMGGRLAFRTSAMNHFHLRFRLGHVPATIKMNGLTGDELVRCQQNDGLRNLLSSTKAAYGQKRRQNVEVV